VNRLLKEKLILVAGSAAITAVVFVGMKYILPLTAPFAAAFLLAVLLEKHVNNLANILPGRLLKGNRTASAIVIVTALAVTVIAVAGAVLCFAFAELRHLLVNYDYYCGICDREVFMVCERVDGWLGLEIGNAYKVVCYAASSLKASLDGSAFAAAMGTSLVRMGGMLKNVLIWFGAFFMFVISTVYMSRDMGAFREWKKNTRFSREAEVVWRELSTLGNVYFKTQLIVICCTASVCTIGLLVAGNPYAVVIGIAIGLLDALPFFGTGTVLLPWSILCLFGGRISYAVILVVIYMITYFEREILEAKLMSSGMDIAPVTMMASIYIGLLVFGFFGFVTGPVSYCLIKAGIQLLKWNIEHAKII